MAGSGGIRAGGAFVELFAKDSSLQKGLKSAEAQVKAFGTAVAGIGAGFGAIGAVITAPLLGASKQWAEASANLVNASARTGVSVEALSALGFAAGQTGSDLEMVEVAIKKMQKALVQGSEENIMAEATFQALGMSVEELMNLSPEEQFNSLARAIAAIPNPTARAGAALQVFGRSGTMILPMINNLDDLTQEAKDFGIVVGTESAEAGHRFEQSMNLLDKVMGALTKTIGSALGPVLSDFNAGAARTLKTVKDWAAANKPLIETAFKVGAALAGIGAAFALAGGAIFTAGVVIGGISATLSSIGAAIGFILSPIGLVVAALVGLGVAFVKYTDMGGKAFEWLGGKFNDLKTEAETTFGGIADALRAGDIELAAQVLWAGLKVEWLKGINFLNSAWEGWGVAVVDKFRSASFELASIWIDAMAAIEKTLITTMGKLESIWTGGLVEMMKRLLPLEGTLGKLFGVDIGKALQDAVGSAAVETGAAGTEGKLKGVEANRQGEQAALTDQQKAEREARQKAAQDRLAGGAADLELAKFKLDELRGKAKEKAAAVKPLVGGEPGAGEGEPLTPEALDQGIQQARSKVDVAGSFSASALATLGTTASKGEDQVKEQKTTNAHLEKLNRKVDINRGVFTA